MKETVRETDHLASLLLQIRPLSVKERNGHNRECCRAEPEQNQVSGATREPFTIPDPFTFFAFVFPDHPWEKQGLHL